MLRGCKELAEGVYNNRRVRHPQRDSPLCSIYNTPTGTNACVFLTPSLLTRVSFFFILLFVCLFGGGVKK